jgi:hypothetical protein
VNTEVDWMFLPVALKLSNGSLTDLFDNPDLTHILCLGGVANSTQRQLPRNEGSMNYPAFTDDSLKMMYEAVRGALASDDALEGLNELPRFRVRETPDWRRHAADLEMEMIKRGVIFDVIDWSSGQATLPL